jgi:hypothetical protein
VLLSEEEWLERREAAARADLKRAVLGLGESVREALQLPEDTCRHPLVHDALESAGDFLGSEAALSLIWGSLTMKKLQQVSGLASRLSS